MLSDGETQYKFTIHIGPQDELLKLAKGNNIGTIVHAYNQEMLVQFDAAVAAHIRVPNWAES
jgi:hypothetical protein